jgi:hypothetical protein
MVTAPSWLKIVEDRLESGVVFELAAEPLRLAAVKPSKGFVGWRCR